MSVALGMPQCCATPWRALHCTVGWLTSTYMRRGDTRYPLPCSDGGTAAVGQYSLSPAVTPGPVDPGLAHVARIAVRYGGRVSAAARLRCNTTPNHCRVAIGVRCGCIRFEHCMTMKKSRGARCGCGQAQAQAALRGGAVTWHPSCRRQYAVTCRGVKPRRAPNFPAG